MKSRNTSGLLLLIAAIAVLIWYVNSAKKISPVRELAVAPEWIGGIGPDGSGGDAMLNREKNRFAVPLDIEDMTVAQIEAFSQPRNLPSLTALNSSITS